MGKLKYLLKNKKGASNVEIIVWISIVLALGVEIFTIGAPLLNTPNTSIKTDNIEHTMVSETPIKEDTLNTLDENKTNTQNITINNIVKDKNDSFLNNLNLNLLSDLISTIIVSIVGFFFGVFIKSRNIKKVKITKK